MYKSLIALVLFCACLPAAPARADLVVGNLTAPGIGGANVTMPEHRLAASFTLDGAFSPANLTSVSLTLAANSATAGLSLYSDSGINEPGSLLADLGTSAVGPAGFFNYDFTPTSPVTLQANTTYWLVLQSLGGSMNWRYTGTSTLDPGSDPSAGIPLNLGTSVDMGADWGMVIGHAPMFAVHATAVPAPGAAALLGIVGLLTARRREGNRRERSARAASIGRAC